MSETNKSLSENRIGRVDSWNTESTEKPQSNEHLRVEYQDVSENMRHYGNMRFAQMTLFAAITAGLTSAIINDKTPYQWLGVIVGFGGAVATSIFWVLEERAADYWHHYVRRAIELEKTLGYAQYSKRPVKNYVTATNAVRVFYAGTLLFWIWSTFKLIKARLGSLPNVWCIVPIILSLVVVGCLVYRILHFREKGKSSQKE
jgi:hypothetical protein